MFDLSRRTDRVTRSISAENRDGAPGGGARATDGTGAMAARDLGRGWKVSPSHVIASGETFEMASIVGSGIITHLWLTTHRDNWRTLLLRFYWDGCDEPAIEVPLGDFFANGWGRFAQVSSTMVAANPNGGFNCYWPMPFAEGARVTIENLRDEAVVVYYQLTWEEGAIETDALRLHAHWRRSNPLPARETHPILDTITGCGHYVGTYAAWGVNSNGWWGEGEIKFYMDGDDEYPTICGTGTEDYFGGAWNFDIPGQGYTAFTTPWLGMPQVICPDGLYESQQRFGMYRWHGPDPIRFRQNLRVNIQALGWRSGGRYLPLNDDIATTAFFYLDQPSTDRPVTPTADMLEIC